MQEGFVGMDNEGLHISQFETQWEVERRFCEFSRCDCFASQLSLSEYNAVKKQLCFCSDIVNSNHFGELFMHSFVTIENMCGVVH